MPTLFLWFPTLAIAVHLFEESFGQAASLVGTENTLRDTLRTYHHGFSCSLTRRLSASRLCRRCSARHLAGSPYWVVVAAIVGANGPFHLMATVRTGRYSPGLVTGVALYLPLAVVGAGQLMRLGLVSLAAVLQAVVIAAAYSAWSSWRHRRHAVVRSAG